MSKKIGFIFPGQGSQSLGMLSDVAEQYPLVQSVFAQASEQLGYDLWAATQSGPEDKLNDTSCTQPALLTASYALWQIWCQQTDVRPVVLAGHSLGEYSALVCAGVIPFEVAVKLVELRGQLMQQAVPAGVGAMAAVLGLSNEDIQQACEQTANGEVVSPVNFNSPGQVVIAGHATAVARASEACDAAGAKRVIPLPVSVPSHCALMQPAAEKLAETLASITFNQPEIPVINNVDVAVNSDAESIKHALVRQLYMPVRWTEVFEKAVSDYQVELLLECGAGNVLTGLGKRINRKFPCAVMNSADGITKALELTL